MNVFSTTEIYLKIVKIENFMLSISITIKYWKKWEWE